MCMVYNMLWTIDNLNCYFNENKMYILGKYLSVIIVSVIYYL